MSSTTTLLERNRVFAERFTDGDLPILPKLRTVVLTCGDARVDPAHILGLELGDAVVIRNNGGRVTDTVVDEVAALAFIVAQIDGDEPGPFELVIMQHTHCGAERFADPKVQHVLKEHIGVDVSSIAIADHEQSLRHDIDRLRDAASLPGHIVVSAYIYDVEHGGVTEIASPTSLESARTKSTSGEVGGSSAVASEMPSLTCESEGTHN